VGRESEASLGAGSTYGRSGDKKERSEGGKCLRREQIYEESFVRVTSNQNAPSCPPYLKERRESRGEKGHSPRVQRWPGYFVMTASRRVGRKALGRGNALWIGLYGHFYEKKLEAVKGSAREDRIDKWRRSDDVRDKLDEKQKRVENVRTSATSGCQ